MDSELEGALRYHNHYEHLVAQTVTGLQRLLNGRKPQFGVVLGSGLGDLSQSIENARTIPYEKIPNFPRTSVEGHEGLLVIGELEGVPIIGLKGRKHFYEVADEPFNNGILQVVFPVHVLAGLGVPNYFATNAAGGSNSDYHVGDIMVIRSHINLLPNPLAGRKLEFRTIDGQVTERFQPMNNAYDAELRKLFSPARQDHKGHVHEGVYLAGTGPSYETEGESIAFRDGLKADAFGMSTTPEVIVARNRGMKAVGISCITNMIAEDGTNATNHEEVKRILNSIPVRERLSSTLQGFFRLYRETYLK